MSDFPGFRPHALRFLRGLKRHNERDWFEAHRDEYTAELLEPMRGLVEELDVELARIAPEIVGHPRRSVFRIHRDVRFSRDKSPYKTHIAAWFFHRDANRQVGNNDGGSAGFYLHIEPGSSLVAGGLWMPPRLALAAIRAALVADPRALERVVHAPAFRRRFGEMDDERMLTRMPRGFPADAPAGRWLRYQSFTAGRTLPDDQVLSSRLPRTIAADFERLRPLVRWINDTLGYRAATRR